MTTLPSLASLWVNFPIEGYSEVKRRIGGRVNADWVVNTCTLRLSRAFNYCGDPYHRVRRTPGLSCLSGSDGFWYAYRVREMQGYLDRKYGPPTVRARSRLYDAVYGKAGIILFVVDSFSDATGHFDLWLGSLTREHEYFSRSREVLLWETL